MATTASGPAGMRDLFETEYESMYRLAFAMLGIDGDAYDVLQDVFVGVTARWESINNPAETSGASLRMRF